MSTFPFVDTSVRPQDDFYQFVNGKWMDSVEIPSDRSSWGSFHELIKSTDARLSDLLKAELQSQGASSNLAARLFESGMDVTKTEHYKFSALQPILSKIDKLNSHSELPELLAFLCTQGLESIITFGVFPDMVNSNIYHGYLEPASLGLPEREMYLKNDEKSIETRTRYVQFIISILEDELELRDQNASQIADDFLVFETNLAKVMLSKEDRRQVEKIYHPYSFEKFSSLVSSWNAEKFFNALLDNQPEEIIVTEPDYYSYLNAEIESISLERIQQYLKYRAILAASPFAHKALDEKRFEFFDHYLQGVPAQKTREERVIKVVNGLVGESLGQLYVKKWFPEEAKSAAVEMTRDVIQAFENRIQKLTWMSDETKAYAKEKLNSMSIKIGYPDNWEKYEGLNISSDDVSITYLNNILAVQKWKWNRDVSRFRQKVDKSEWFMAPQVVNAYYHPLYNEIVFPAAILQPPFFDHQADAAVNYGAIGAVIGHEITHGFDDQGSRFDKAGNFFEWWTSDDRERFNELTGKVISQADEYFPLENTPINGAFTLGENIADLGGLSVGYDALAICLNRNTSPGDLEGYTQEQRYFMSWATVWRTKIRTEALRMQIQTDPHPPGSYRAIAAPRNLEAFHEAFSLSSSDKLYLNPEERVRIW